MVISYSAVQGQSFLIQSPKLNALSTPSVAPSVVGPLSTSGNQIMQADGKPVTLRGVVMPGLEQSGTLAGTGVSQQAVIEAKAWGANFVRVPLGEQFWLTSQLRLRLELHLDRRPGGQLDHVPRHGSSARPAHQHRGWL